MKKFFKKHPKLITICCILLIILIGISIYAYIGYTKVKKSIDILQSDIDVLKQDQNNKSYSGIVSDVEKMQPDIENLQASIHYFSLLNFVPYLNGYYQNADNASAAVLSVDKGAIKIVIAAEPLANSLGYGNNKVVGEAKISAFVDALPQLTPAITAATPDFNNAKTDIALINPSYLPSITIKGINPAKDFPTFETDFDNVIGFLPKINALAPIIQKGLGDPTPQTYLLLFENDKELRPGGGFITVYGYLHFDHGKLADIHTDDIYNLDALETNSPPTPIQMKEYNTTSTWYIRDSNLSPDIPTDAKVAEKFYNSIPYADRETINGVVYIDTEFVSSLLRAVGSVSVPEYDTTVNADNLAYDLEYYSEKVRVGLDEGNRKSFVNILFPKIKTKIFDAQKGDLLNLLTIGFSDFSTKHIAIYANDPVIEGTLQEYAMSGDFPSVQQEDFFSMVEANLGGAKADFYIKRSINQTVVHNAHGYQKTVTITFTNNQVYDNWLNGPYTAWLRFYIPSGSRLVSLTGVDGVLRQYSELGRSVIDDHIRVPVKYATTDPAARLVVALSYYLPSSIPEGDRYKEFVFKQPGVPNYTLIFNYLGKMKSDNLTTDTEYSF